MSRLAIAFFLLLPSAIHAAGSVVDLTRAIIVTPPGLTGPESQAVRMLIEEVEKRSWVDWTRAGPWPTEGTAVILIGPAAGVQKIADAHGVRLTSGLPRSGPEGFQIGIELSGKAPVVWVSGNDSRGLLFGIGRLLRELRMERQRVTLSSDFQIATTPQTPLRGHQIGYRPKTNSYDGWTVPMWEQYIRDLAVFGCSAIEIMPPRTDDDADSPHFPLPPLRMMTEVSRLADSYGLDVWVWYPAMDKDYTDAKTVEFALKEWGDVFKALPRVDAVFVPGGDPGHTPPKVLFALLEKQTANLRRHHPKAQMWMSPQSFTGPLMDDFYTLMKQEPSWLAGIVYGPQVRVPIAELRAKVPSRYAIRDYPDITHSRTCQYPVPDWDLAFQLTEARECCNPRPLQTAHLFHYTRPHAFGFITYSEGCHDDVNKMVWSAVGWDDKADIHEVMRQYGRYFIGPALGDRFADGLMALERNWSGPVIENAGIDETLKLFQEMERAAGPREKLNWRFQQALYRAYYDAYVRGRLQHESGTTDAARAKLREADKIGAVKAMAEAEAILDRGAKEKTGAELRARTSELAEALFQSIHAQLSVKRYHAIAVGRGANLDSIDAPLSDAAWLRAEIAATRQLGDEPARVARLDATVNREDPGQGGFYDDLGDPKRQPHLVRGLGWERDPAYFASPLATIGRGAIPPATPRTWWHHAQTHYDNPLRMHYPELDRNAAYRIRVVYGQAEGRKLRLVAGANHEVHGYLSKPFEPLEFDVPTAATANGKLDLTWSQDPGVGGAGRGCQVAEVWLLRRPRDK